MKRQRNNKMPQKVFKFKGINRRSNEFQSTGECEELVNLRPMHGGGYKVVRPKRLKRYHVQYDAIYEHSFGDTYNEIIVTSGIVKWHKSGDEEITITDLFKNKKVSVSYAGNVLMVYCEEMKRQLVFKFEDEEYKSYDISIKQITNVEVSYAYSASTLTAYNTAVSDDDTVAAYNSAMYKAASGFNNQYPHGLCGAAMIGCTYELEDGSEVWSTAFVTANVARVNGYKIPTIETGSKQVTVSGATHVTLKLRFADVEAKGIKRINIYASRPVFQYEIEYNTGASYVVNELKLEDVNLHGQPMYYQGSVIPDGTTASYLLKFTAEQAGERLMDVTSGCMERTGESVSYNNRFHFFRSEVQHLIQVPTISDRGDSRSGTSSWWIAYVKFENGWKMINNKYYFSESGANDFVYPMAGVKQLAFVKAIYDDDGEFSVPYYDMFFVNLKDSTAYNYSYAFDVTPTLVQIGGFEDDMIEAGQVWGDGFDSKVLQKEESNAINVSAPYNPYVFPVEYSYSFGGEILDVTTSYLPISATQVGQYPLNVFTSAGVFALEQGNGAVLYSNIVPLQPQVIDGKATSTPYGTFFVSSKSLYLLSGREAVNISYILNGELELRLRELESYRRLCCGLSSHLHDFTLLLSKDNFESYIEDVNLVYDQLQNELYISSNDYSLEYSYVFNLDEKTYHKVGKKYLRAQNGSRYVVEIDGQYMNVVDMFVEDDSVQPVLLQSRPMSLDVLYTHIQRLILLADAKLEGDDQNLCLSVFGSDNLYDWKCIISSQKHNTVFRQIRTNRAAKSYKDYVILISGTVDTNTDLSDLIADYTVVSRRLG